MARFPLHSGILLAVACLFGGSHSFAQAPASSQTPSTTNADPGVDAPQPQKKKPAGTKKPADTVANPETPPSANGNAFPEDISRRAAQDSQAASPPADPSPAKAGTPAASRPGGANPFPEDISRQAEKAARDADKPTPLPSGVSSSQSSGIVSGPDADLQTGGTPGGTLEVTNPSRASKDTQVGDFYLLREDAKGAYLRYQDAIKFDPTNVDAIFGIAEAARMLGKPAEAVRNYQLYLDILPNGPKSKRALKGLQLLAQAPAKSGH